MTSNVAKTEWQYLEKRPHSWRQQLYIKGRKLTAFTVWSDAIANEMTPEVRSQRDPPKAVRRSCSVK
jgi:hypothetical protein